MPTLWLFAHTNANARKNCPCAAASARRADGRRAGAHTREPAAAPTLRSRLRSCSSAAAARVAEIHERSAPRAPSPSSTRASGLPAARGRDLGEQMVGGGPPRRQVVRALRLFHLQGTVRVRPDSDQAESQVGRGWMFAELVSKLIRNSQSKTK